MNRILGKRGRGVAVIAALTAVMCAAVPARGAQKMLTFSDSAGDANPASYWCAVDCGGVLAPASERSIDIISATVEDKGSALVFTTRVTDLAHVSQTSTPDDKVGYDFGVSTEAVTFTVIAERTASHQAPGAYLVAQSSNSGSISNRHPVPVSFDHGDDTVRVSVSKGGLEEAVAEVCPTCGIPTVDEFGHVVAYTYLLSAALSPVGQTGAGLGAWEYGEFENAALTSGDRAQPDRTPTALPGLSSKQLYLGNGPTTGTVAWSEPGGWLNTYPCPTETASVELTATVALSNGSTHYTGPVTLLGTGESNHCNSSQSGTFHLKRGSLSGTDMHGVALQCPTISGLAVGQRRWTLTAGGPCTLNGKPIDLSMHVEGAYLPTGVTTSGIVSGTVVGSLFLSAYT